MRLTALLASLTVVSLLFAGCSGGGDDDGGPSTSSSSSASSSSATSSSSSTSPTGSSTSTSTGPGSNKAPTGTFTAVVNGTTVAFAMNGTDEDGDQLSWTLSFGDASGDATGDDLPANLTHEYAAGTYTANLTISDGTDAVSYDLGIEVVGSGAGVTSQDAEAEWDAAYNPGCASPENYDAVPMTEGVTYAVFAVEAGTWGLPFTASFDSSAAQDHILFVDAGGAVLLEVEVGVTTLGWVATGTVPADAVTGVFFGCGGLPGEHVVYHAGAE